jgi:hypothetical protein
MKKKQRKQPWTYNSEHAPKQKQNRLVIFAGPHKTASTSVQWFYSRNASNQLPEDKIKPAFNEWTWPRFREPDNGNRLFSLNRNWTDKKLHFYKNRIVDAYNEANVILGTENLCFFESTGSIDLLLNWTTVSEPEMIVHYRTPRTDQWLSLWKQYTRLGEGKVYENYTFYDYLCHAEDPFPSQINPLHLVSKFLQREWRTHLIDMAGVVSDELDISHTIACEILQVPCEFGWVQGLQGEVVLRNQREGNANLTDFQYSAFERVLQQHDCTYMTVFKNTHHLTIHHWQELWKECDLYSPANIEQLQNFSDVVDVLKEITKCPAYGTRRSHLYYEDAKRSARHAIAKQEVAERTILLEDLRSNIDFLATLVILTSIFMVMAYKRPKRKEPLNIKKNKIQPAASHDSSE